ncbi:MAG: (2Fe-2S) ferredoxin domain-containing protein [Firmicutes bacterium]|nr:(2Fe-2S) ferredoxin domain-containing protein [Bacillota bacterium]
MLTIAVCVGSSCHLKGSYQVISRFQALIHQWELQDKVELKGVFCLGHCTGAVAVQLNDGPIESVTPDNVDEVFRRQVLPQVEVE